MYLIFIPFKIGIAREILLKALWHHPYEPNIVNWLLILATLESTRKIFT